MKIHQEPRKHHMMLKERHLRYIAGSKRGIHRYFLRTYNLTEKSKCLPSPTRLHWRGRQIIINNPVGLFVMELQVFGTSEKGPKSL